MSEILFQTYIDQDKWNSARWYATGFLSDRYSETPPYIGLVYKDIRAGRDIFTEWRRRLGPVDQFDEIRISLIEGDILGEDPGYSVHIGTNLDGLVRRTEAEGRTFEFDKIAMLSRFNRMFPAKDSPNLPRFKKDLQKHKRYFLIPVSERMEPQFDLQIEKQRILFRSASSITADDLDAAVFPPGYFEHDRSVQ